MKVIGITGMIGSGKTELLKNIEKRYNCRVYLADEIAADFQKKGGACYDAMRQLLPGDCFDGDGNLDRKRTAERIFADDRLRTGLNKIIHPAVDKYIRQEIETYRDSCDYIFVESAILLSTSIRNICNETWYIYAREEVRYERLKNGRDMDPENVRAILKKQPADEYMRKNCSWVIDNSDEMELTLQQTSLLLG